MPQARKSKANQTGQPAFIAHSRHSMFFVTMVVLTVVTILLGFKLFGPEEKPVIHIAQPVASSSPTVGVAVNTPADVPERAVVGIVAGHKGYDPGAVCDDGLTEVEVNEAVAVEVVGLLRRRGVQADLLEEYDSRLTDYQADALVSIHVDSCNIPGATGFKVARVTESAIPEAEDALVACINQEYAVYTGLPQHPASITDNMTNYHAFNEIHPLTPGVIIEAGFLLDDRDLLQHRPKLVARGIAAGILCFLEE
jgi:N-acetylmuramoyl-L-alanine amidase